MDPRKFSDLFYPFPQDLNIYRASVEVDRDWPSCNTGELAGLLGDESLQYKKGHLSPDRDKDLKKNYIFGYIFIFIEI